MLRYTPISNVMNYLSNKIKESTSRTQIMSWALQAYKKLNPKGTKDNACMLLEISNHTCKLPEEVKDIFKVSYTTEIKEEEAHSLLNCVEEEIPEQEENCIPTVWDLDVVYRPCIQCTYNYRLMLDSIFYRNCLIPLDYKGNKKPRKKDIPRINNFGNWYTVDVYGYIHTNMCDCTVLIEYERLPKDGDKFLVVDHQAVLDYLAEFVRFKYFTELYDSQKQGSRERRNEVKVDLEIAFRKAKGALIQRETSRNEIEHITSNTDPITKPFRKNEKIYRPLRLTHQGYRSRYRGI